MSKGASLAEFAARPKPVNCWTCNLPEIAEILEAERNGIGPATITNWLVEEKGYPRDDVRSRVKSHHQGRHYER